MIRSARPGQWEINSPHTFKITSLTLKHDGRNILQTSFKSAIVTLCSIGKMRSYHGHWGPGLRSTRTWPIIFIFSMNVHCQAVSRHSRQYSFHFLLKNKLPASLPLLVSPPLCWQHEGNFYAIIAAEKEVFMLSKTQSTLLQCTQGSAQALKLTQYSAQRSLVRRADRRRVNTDNSPLILF